MKRMVLAILAVVSLWVADLIQPALADATYPNKPVTLIVSYPPGGSTDIAGRLLAEALQEHFKRPFVVENRAGAGGVVGHTANANAKPDGYTLLFAASPPQTISPHMSREPLTFDPLKGYTPIGIVFESEFAIFASTKYQPNTVAELIADAKARPGKVKYGSAGIGSGNHLASAQFEQRFGVSMLHVPYNGGAPAVRDMVNGTVDIIIIGVTNAASQVQAGTAKALAVLGDRPSKLLPGVPTIKETGVGEFDKSVWYGLEGPPGMDRAVVEKLNAALKSLESNAAFVEKADKVGFSVHTSTPTAFEQRVIADYNDVKVVIDKIK